VSFSGWFVERREQFLRKADTKEKVETLPLVSSSPFSFSNSSIPLKEGVKR
jgi:hypothetical protein